MRGTRRSHELARAEATLLVDVSASMPHEVARVQEPACMICGYVFDCKYKAIQRMSKGDIKLATVRPPGRRLDPVPLRFSLDFLRAHSGVQDLFGPCGYRPFHYREYILSWRTEDRVPHTYPTHPTHTAWRLVQYGVHYTIFFGLGQTISRLL